MTWAKWFEKARHDRVVARTNVVPGSDVSTVFLGLDHQWGDGPPLIFETMVFGGPLDQETERYSTWEEAEAGHAQMVERVRRAPGGGKGAGNARHSAPRRGSALGARRARRITHARTSRKEIAVTERDYTKPADAAQEALLDGIFDCASFDGSYGF